MIKSVEVFDPATCCSTGVCGPAVDPALARFAGDVEWLSRHGLKVERFNLGQEPGAFAERTVVREALAAKGQSCLPLTLVDGHIVCEGVYPTRDELVVLASVPVSVPSYSPVPVAEASPRGGGCCPTGSC
ncbi:MAG: arsenite efflux transporter metallochaperone ArsD [Candidatus Dormibacteria bacterium]